MPSAILQVAGDLFFAVAPPAVIIAIAQRELRDLADIEIPTWALPALWLALTIGVLTARVQYTESRNRRKAASFGARLPPVVKAKYLGNLDVLKSLYDSYLHGYPGDDIADRLEENGYIMDYFPMWRHIVMTACPEHLQAILATDFQNFVKGPSFQDAMSSVLGMGIFNADGEMWKYHRSMARPFFTRDRISHFDLFDRHCDKAISEMKRRLRDGYSVDFQDLMYRFTLDSATEFLFGNCVDSLKAGLPYPHTVSPESVPQRSAEQEKAEAFSHAFLEAQEVIAGRERAGYPIWPILELFKDRTKSVMKVVDAYVDPIVKEALEKKRSADLVSEKLDEKLQSADEIGEDDTLLDHLVRSTTDPKILKDETLNIMIAGRDTTATTLTFIIYFLSMYPDMNKRLREEVLNHVGPTQQPTFEAIKDMKYLRAVINETLRIYPVVPFNTRECVNDTVWPSDDPNDLPIFIPAGTKVPYSVFVMHRRKDLWGPDAEEFDPDRFLDERLHKYLTPRPFIFLPFNAGPRICLGQQFAYNEISFMLIRLMQNFSSFSCDSASTPPEFRPPSKWQEEDLGLKTRKGRDTVFPKISLTLYTGGGLWVKAADSEEGTS